MSSRHLFSLLGRLTDGHGEKSCVLAIPGRRCNSSINTNPGRRLEWLGREFCLPVALGLEARDCVGCLKDVGFIATGACTVTYITREHKTRHSVYAPGISSAVNSTFFSCIK